MITADWEPSLPKVSGGPWLCSLVIQSHVCSDLSSLKFFFVQASLCSGFAYAKISLCSDSPMSADVVIRFWSDFPLSYPAYVCICLCSLPLL